MTTHHASHSRLRKAVLAGTALALIVLAAPAQAQLFGGIVFDPSNYAQNLLTAARELQQVNNEIQSLQNQATSLTNQARNLADLPYSSLSQIDQSITQTTSLLSQAQRISYDVNAIDQAFGQTYPINYTGSTSSQQLLTDAQTRWQNALAGFQDAMRVQASVVQNLNSTHTQIDALVNASQSATGALQAAQSGNQFDRASNQAACRSHRRHGRNRPRAKSRRRTRDREPGTGADRDHPLSQLRRRLPARLC